MNRVNKIRSKEKPLYKVSDNEADGTNFPTFSVDFDEELDDSKPLKVDKNEEDPKDDYPTSFHSEDSNYL